MQSGGSMIEVAAGAVSTIVASPKAIARIAIASMMTPSAKMRSAYEQASGQPWDTFAPIWAKLIEAALDSYD